jgi:hypothetical protein
MDPKVISASKMAFYRGCPLAYVFKYEQKVKVPTVPAAAFGVAIHYMADQLYKKKEKGEIVVGIPKWGDVDKCLGSWDFLWRQSIMAKEECRKSKVVFKSEMEKWTYYWTGQRILKGFYNKMVTLPWPTGTEKDYRTEIAGEKVMAKIDRLDIREEKGELRHIITDYKTDRISPAADTFLLHRLPQFTLYSRVYEELTGIKPHMEELHMRSGKSFKTIRNQEDYNYLTALIRKVANDIRNEEIIPYFGFHCNMCHYKKDECKKYGVGVDGKLKALEIAMQTSPEIDDWLSFDVENKQIPLFEKVLSKIPKSLGWIRSTLDNVFADYIMMKDTIEEIGVDSAGFLSALQQPDDLEDFIKEFEDENIGHN